MGRTETGAAQRGEVLIRARLMSAVGLGGLLAGAMGELWGVRSALWLGASITATSWVPFLFSPLRHQPRTC
ncbi:hypothetical protein [Nonomuraea longispora]|uniref:hypothetical protein n=1 Tax=Nonomuraea longispora TaxID=1848320 RepID=UPI001404E515|nr:hypothetical protein [Nonomuraea longispora]